jgi:hypothetical protein
MHHISLNFLSLQNPFVLKKSRWNTILPSFLAPQPGLSFGLLHKIWLNFLDASQQLDGTPFTEIRLLEWGRDKDDKILK